MEIICLKKQSNIVQQKKRGIENLVNGFQVKPATKDPDNKDLDQTIM
jgi:hypothetical protein